MAKPLASTERRKVAFSNAWAGGVCVLTYDETHLKEIDVAARKLADDGNGQRSTVLIHRQIAAIRQFVTERHIQYRTRLPLGAHTKPKLLKITFLGLSQNEKGVTRVKSDAVWDSKTAVL